jgi:hypothetical protein
MAIRITDDTMTLESGSRVVATARFSKHAAADGNGAWIVTTVPLASSTATRRSRRWRSPGC